MSSHSLGAAVDNLCTLSLPRPGCNSLRTPNRSESGRPPHAHADFGPARQVVSIASRMTPADMAHRACLRQLVANKPALTRRPGGSAPDVGRARGNLFADMLLDSQICRRMR